MSLALSHCSDWTAAGNGSRQLLPPTHPAPSGSPSLSPWSPFLNPVRGRGRPCQPPAWGPPALSSEGLSRYTAHTPGLRGLTRRKPRAGTPGLALPEASLPAGPFLCSSIEIKHTGHELGALATAPCVAITNIHSRLSQLPTPRLLPVGSAPAPHPLPGAGKPRPILHPGPHGAERLPTLLFESGFSLAQVSESPSFPRRTQGKTVLSGRASIRSHLCLL